MRAEEHIVSFSGGKDSTAMLLMMIENKMTIDRIICIDTGKEFPALMSHIEKVEERIYPLKIDKTRIDFDYWFRDHIKKEGDKKGEKGYGWPGVNSRWCSRLKREAFLSMVETGEYNPREYGNKRKSIIKGKKLYIGYAYDEEYRTKDQSRMEEYPLINWEITQTDSLKYCYLKGFDWGKLYKRFKRVSCWCCPLSRMGELKTLYSRFPVLWSELEKMDRELNRPSWKFRDGYTVADLTKRFKKETNRMYR